MAMSRSFATALLLVPLVLILVLSAINHIADRSRTVHSIGYHLPRSFTLGAAPPLAAHAATVIPFSHHGQATGFVVKAGHTAKVFEASSLDPPYEPLYTIADVPDGAIAIGDLNADGRTDMVVAAASGIQVLIWKTRTGIMRFALRPLSSLRLTPSPPSVQFSWI